MNELISKPIKKKNDWNGKIYYEIASKILEIGELEHYYNHLNELVGFYSVSLEIYNPFTEKNEIVSGVLFKKTMENANGMIKLGTITYCNVIMEGSNFNYIVYSSKYPIDMEEMNIFLELRIKKI